MSDKDLPEIIQVGKNTYYIDLPSKIGIYEVNPGQVILIDASTQDNFNKVVKVLENRGWTPQTIFNTHSHADHIGCNKSLQEKYDCSIYANAMEAPFIRNPLLAACFLYGGHPYKIMRHSFLMAKPSHCLDLEAWELPQGFEFAPLYGHAMGMTALKTPDEVWFTGDIAVSIEALTKYPVSFSYDPGEYLNSLDLALQLRGNMFVCSHADPVKDLGELVEFNRNTMEARFDFIVEICRERAMGYDAILQACAEHYRLTLNHMLIANMGSALRSEISTLIDRRRLKSLVENNVMVYRAI